MKYNVPCILVFFILLVLGITQNCYAKYHFEEYLTIDVSIKIESKKVLESDCNNEEVIVNNDDVIENEKIRTIVT